LGPDEGLRELAKPWAGGERIKAVIDRAARRAGLSYWRAFDIWYRKARRVEDFECDAIADAVAKKREEEARNELHELRMRITRLEARMAATDPDFFRPEIDASRYLVRRTDGGGSAADRTLVGRAVG
jgi:hypothetical protein